MMEGLYVITDHASKTHDQLLQDVDHALLGGASVVQYRDKYSALKDRQQDAVALATLCRERGALFIVNDDVELARQTNADGVHLGSEDLDLPAARTQLGPGKIIGISCYADIGLALNAQRQKADYVAFGRFYSSVSKPQATPANIDVLRQAQQQVRLPIVAIGGITAENGAPLVEAGADMLAVINGVFSQDDVLQAARDLTALFVR